MMLPDQEQQRRWRELRDETKRKQAEMRRKRAEQLRAEIEAFEAMKAEHAAAIEALMKKEARA
ncbi:hypothetical protein [Azotobacter chroococcum]|uniref:Uncharacterized protein n=1 Tax=Azotobacter chroococcum TaxID=353 RepID=A0AAP9YHS6_9GAMM|nr:hypothetical protein [Azotobacter chroococcum]QQE90457.1 hypothetical protein GKQ51_09370 [Azotobacter chroococcum]